MSEGLAQRVEDRIVLRIRKRTVKTRRDKETEGKCGWIRKLNCMVGERLKKKDDYFGTY